MHVTKGKGRKFCSFKRSFHFKRVRVLVYICLYGDSAGTSGKCLFYQKFRLKRVLFSETPLYVALNYAYSTGLSQTRPN